jgi:beta-glucosidase/6-phospho-beta-glucosidase/beta-galactosidase
LSAGAADFFGLNYYTTRLITNGEQPDKVTAIMGAIESTDPSWKRYITIKYNVRTIVFTHVYLKFY